MAPSLSSFLTLSRLLSRSVHNVPDVLNVPDVPDVPDVHNVPDVHVVLDALIASIWLIIAVFLYSYYFSIELIYFNTGGVKFSPLFCIFVSFSK